MRPTGSFCHCDPGASWASSKPSWGSTIFRWAMVYRVRVQVWEVRERHCRLAVAVVGGGAEQLALGPYAGLQTLLRSSSTPVEGKAKLLGHRAVEFGGSPTIWSNRSAIIFWQIQMRPDFLQMGRALSVDLLPVLIVSWVRVDWIFKERCARDFIF